MVIISSKSKSESESERLCFGFNYKSEFKRQISGSDNDHFNNIELYNDIMLYEDEKINYNKKHKLCDTDKIKLKQIPRVK